MKELFEALEHEALSDFRSSQSVLLDTCFLVHAFEHQLKRLEKFCEQNDVLICSFNLEELDHIKHRIPHMARENARRFFKHDPNIKVLDISVHPGQRQEEHAFVERVDQELLIDIADPSDAVLIATAIQSHSHVLTLDKHHLFTTHLENYLTRYGIEVHKSFDDICPNEFGKEV